MFLCVVGKANKQKQIYSVSLTKSDAVMQVEHAMVSNNYIIIYLVRQILGWNVAKRPQAKRGFF